MIFGRKRYPIDFATFEQTPEKLREIFLDLRPHDGTYIGVSELDGAFLSDSVGELFELMQIGDSLTVAPDNDMKLSNPTLAVSRKDGSVIGYLPFQASLLPNMLSRRGLSIFAFLEAKRFDGGIPRYLVSIYCEKY